MIFGFTILQILAAPWRYHHNPEYYQRPRYHQYNEYELERSSEFLFAAALIKPDITGGSVYGAFFIEEYEGEYASFTVRLYGLEPNTMHGFHIHENPVNAQNNCTTAGPHFNPFQAQHGDRLADVRHVGDLGNIQSDSNGRLFYRFFDKRVSLFGQNSVLGRTIIVHKDVDDLGLGGQSDSLTTGHAGARLSCGTIIQRQRIIDWNQ